MTRRRPSLALRCVALASLLIPAASVALAACDDNGTLAVRPDSGAPSDATTPDVGAGMDAGMDAAEEPEQEASCAVDAGPLDDAAIALGLQLVGQHKCENCHGTTLSGNNDGVPSLTAEGGLAYPPNLTPDPATGLGCWTNAQIENAILNGIDNEGMSLCSPMPVFGHLAGDAGLDQAQAEAIVEYLRSLPPDVNNVPNTPDCPVPPPVEAGVEAGAHDSGAADASGDAASGDSGPITDGSADGGG